MKDKIVFNKYGLLGGMKDRRGWMGQSRWIYRSKLSGRKNLEFGKTWAEGGLMGVEKIRIFSAVELRCGAQVSSRPRGKNEFDSYRSYRYSKSIGIK